MERVFHHMQATFLPSPYTYSMFMCACVHTCVYASMYVYIHPVIPSEDSGEGLCGLLDWLVCWP